MTDTTQAEANTAGPTIEAVTTDGSENSVFDKQLNEFLNFSFEGQADPHEEGYVAPEPAPLEGTKAAATTPAGTAPVDPASAVKTAVEGDQTVVDKMKAGDVDPALVLEMLGFGSNKAATPPTGDATTVQTPTPATPAVPTGADDAPFRPFKDDFQLPPAMTAALFEAEDSETRSRALVGLISGALNTAMQVMDQRIREVHAPRIAEQFSNQQRTSNVQQEITTDFYRENPDLQNFGHVVQRATEVIAKQDPNRTWAECKPLIASLVRKTLANTGVVLPSSTPPTPRAAPAAKATDSPFLTDGARPSSVGDPADQNSPAAILASMSEF